LDYAYRNSEFQILWRKIVAIAGKQVARIIPASPLNFPELVCRCDLDRMTIPVFFLGSYKVASQSVDLTPEGTKLTMGGKTTIVEKHSCFSLLSP
jgi:hypothetical protein